MVAETCNVKFLYFNLSYYMHFVRLVVTFCWLPACSVRYGDPGDRFPWSLLPTILHNLQVCLFTKARCNLVAVFGTCCGDFSNWFPWSLLSVLVPVSKLEKCTLGMGYDFVVTFRFEPLGGVYGTIFTC